MKFLIHADGTDEITNCSLVTAASLTALRRELIADELDAGMDDDDAHDFADDHLVYDVTHLTDDEANELLHALECCDDCAPISDDDFTILRDLLPTPPRGAY